MTNWPGPTKFSRRAVVGGALAVAAAARMAPARAQSDAMKALAAAAQAEGAVVVDGPAVDVAREFLTQEFQRAYGIPVSYIPTTNSASGARVRAERAAGKFLLDVLVAGGDTPTMTYLPAGWLDRVEPILIAPDVLDKTKWRDGHLWYEDEAHTILRTLSGVTPELVINTKLVKPGEVTTWKSLLDPKWQGKIVAKDPAVSGAGTSAIALLYLHFGPEYVKRLYKDQQPVLSRDARQAMQFLANGTYPILMGPEPTEIVRISEARLPDRAGVSDRRPGSTLRELRTDLAGQQSAASERREAFHQLAGRPRAAEGVRRSAPVRELAHRREVRRRSPGLGVSAKGNELHRHLRLRFRNPATRRGHGESAHTSGRMMGKTMTNRPTLSRRAAIAGTMAAAAASQFAPAGAQSDAMKALIEAAKAEGSVAVDGPPIDAARELLTQGFQRAYGIPVSYIGTTNSASGARVRAERAAGKYLLDVLVAGGDTPTMTYLPSGWLDKVEPILVAPDVVDKRRWKDGHLWFVDDGHYILRTQAYVTPELVVNSKIVKPRDVSKWKALLDPKYQGKIVAKDPGVSGAGTSLIAMFYMHFGPDFVETALSRAEADHFARRATSRAVCGPRNISDFDRPGTDLHRAVQSARLPARIRVSDRRAIDHVGRLRVAVAGQ